MLPWIEKQFGDVEATRRPEDRQGDEHRHARGRALQLAAFEPPHVAPRDQPRRGARAHRRRPARRPVQRHAGGPLRARPRQVLRHRQQHRQVRWLPRPRRLQREAPVALHARDAARLRQHRRPLGRPGPRQRPGGEVLHVPVELPVARRRIAAARARAGDHGPRHALRGGRAPAPARGGVPGAPPLQLLQRPLPGARLARLRVREGRHEGHRQPGAEKGERGHAVRAVRLHVAQGPHLRTSWSASATGSASTPSTW